MANILLVEDDLSLNKGVTFAMTKDQHKVYSTYTIDEAEGVLREHQIDLILLDINLPDGNGIDFCQQIRENSPIPIVFLTANDTEEEMVLGFQMGCDDYISKPFSVEILRQRVLAVLRRTELVVKRNHLIYKELEIDYDKHIVKRANKEIKLTATEYKLIEVLAKNQGQVLTRTMILEKLWDIDGKFVEENALSVNIRRLRQKVELDSKNPQYIYTVFGIGYTFGE